VLAYGVVPLHAVAGLVALVGCVVIFTCLGALLGAVLRRTLPVVPLLFGLAMPFYVDSGALEPTRLDGETNWTLAHASPGYYAIGILEWAFHGIVVTPESVTTNVAVLVTLAGLSVALARVALARARWR